MGLSWGDGGKPSANCIDVVAGIPSQEGIHFMEKKKKRCERSSAGVESTVCAHGRQARILTSE